MEEQQLLIQPIRELGMSAGFVSASEQMGYHNLREITDTPAEIIRKKKGFSYGWLAELSEYLQQRQLLHLLQGTPGRSQH